MTCSKNGRLRSIDHRIGSNNKTTPMMAGRLGPSNQIGCAVLYDYLFNYIKKVTVLAKSREEKINHFHAAWSSSLLLRANAFSSFLKEPIFLICQYIKYILITNFHNNTSSLAFPFFFCQNISYKII